jgi:demethylmenaquinone methyltransferase / 2-methoxy-6-polyprenyl-1,4-benzoquinol methylase
LHDRRGKSAAEAWPCQFADVFANALPHRTHRSLFQALFCLPIRTSETLNDKRAFVRAMFSRIAPNYDLANRLMTFGMDQRWRKRTAQVTLSKNDQEPLVLDVGTGTGDQAIMISALSPHAHIVGVDLTTEMMALAASKVSRISGDMMLRLVNGDSLELPFPANTFSGICSSFVLRNVTSLDRAFAEMVRVAKPNAPIVALEITPPRIPVWRTLFRFYFFQIAPLLGGLVSRDLPAYRYLPYSLTVFVSADELAGIMSRAGVRNVRYILLNLGTVAIHFGIK